MDAIGWDDETKECAKLVNSKILIVPVTIRALIDEQKNKTVHQGSFNSRNDDLRFARGDDLNCSSSGCSSTETLSARIGNWFESSNWSIGFFNFALFMSGNGSETSVTDSSGSMNPLLTITSIGNGLNTIAAILILLMILIPIIGNILSYTPVGAAASLADKAKGTVKSDSGKKGFFSSIAAMVAFTFISMLVAAGFTMAYLIPFLPMLIWMMVVVGWLVMIAEAMVGAPMALMLGGVIPEGEGIAGTRLNKALGMIVSLIMKPFLSVFSLVLSLSVLYIAFGFFNLLFWGTAKISSGFGLFEILAFLILYPTGALMIAKRCFDIIHLLPDRLLQWFEAAPGGAFGAQDVSGTISQATDSIGHKAGQIGGAVEKGVTAHRQKQEREEEKEERKREQQNV